MTAPFGWQCLTCTSITPFPAPPHRTGMAVFPHPAHREGSRRSDSCGTRSGGRRRIRPAAGVARGSGGHYTTMTESSWWVTRMVDPAGKSPRWALPAPDERVQSPGIAEDLRRVADGDRDARAWLYDAFAARLFRRLRARYGGGAAGLDAEELLHDSFLSLFEHGHVLAGFLSETPPAEQTGTRFESFLWNHACGIASNRRRSLRRRGAEPLPAEEPRAGTADPERESVGRDTLARLQECLEKRGRRIFLYYKLRFCDGLTPDEIAHATGWSRKATYKLRLALGEAAARCAEALGIA